MKKIKIDWLEAKKEFLLDYSMSLKDVAEKYNFSYSKIRKVSAKRSWYQDKKQIQKLLSDTIMKELEFKIIENHLEKMRQIKPSFGEKYLRKTEQATKRVLKAMSR